MLAFAFRFRESAMQPISSLCLAGALFASAGVQAITVDPNLWLEDVEGKTAAVLIRPDAD